MRYAIRLGIGIAIAGMLVWAWSLLTSGRRALTPQDALFTIPNVDGVVQLFSDADNDGFHDLVVQRDDRPEGTTHLDLISCKTGKLIRSLWSAPSDSSADLDWDVKGDADGDGVSDLLVGQPEDGPGRLSLISGNSGEVKVELHGTAIGERLGTSVSFLGDVDGDGCDDFAFGATELPVLWAHGEHDVVSRGTTYHEGGKTDYVVFDDGSELEARSYEQESMRRRSSRPGYASARSGRDGTELWRRSGLIPGHAFGTRVRSLGDLDGDRVTDLCVQCDHRSTRAIQVLSGRQGTTILEIETSHGMAGPAGDVDGDGVPDLLLDSIYSGSDAREGGVKVVSGESAKVLFELPYPDMMSAYGVSIPVGDVDRDGHADIALGEPNFNLRADGPWYLKLLEPDPRNMSLTRGMGLASNPWNGFSWESGVALVYSGKTRRPILGVWAMPGTRLGLGHCIVPLPDVSGDGQPDILVTDESTGHVFAGPGTANE